MTADVVLTGPVCFVQKALAERGDALQHKERSLSEAARAAEQRASSLAAREGKVQGLETQLAQLQAERSSLQLKKEVLASTEAEVRLLKIWVTDMTTLGLGHGQSVLQCQKRVAACSFCRRCWSALRLQTNRLAQQKAAATCASIPC